MEARAAELTLSSYMLSTRMLAWTLLLFSSTPGPAQTPECAANHRLLGTASTLASNGAYQASLAAYDTALVQCSYCVQQWIEATEFALLHGDTTKAIRYLCGAYGNGGQPMLTYSRPVQHLLAQGFHEPYLSELRSAMNAWAIKADTVWIEALVEMKELDQSHRAFDALSRHNDSLNLERLIQLTKERGFPAPSRTGSSFGIVHLLIWHHRAEVGASHRFEHFMELAQSAMDQCLIEPDFLAGILDYAAWEKKEPMPYGTLIGHFRDRIHETHLPEASTLNANRARVGLLPIEVFAKQLEIPLTDLPIGR